MTAGGGAGPLQRAVFAVDLGSGVKAEFAEAAGLDTARRPARAAAGGPAFQPVGMPKLGRVGNVALRKGLFRAGPALWALVDAIAMNTAARRDVTISLVGETGVVQRRWILVGAWPTRVTGLGLEAGGAEVEVGSLELAYETMKLGAG